MDHWRSLLRFVMTESAVSALRVWAGGMLLWAFKALGRPLVSGCGCAPELGDEMAGADFAGLTRFLGVRLLKLKGCRRA
jgi:hypothetical protein